MQSVEGRGTVFSVSLSFEISEQAESKLEPQCNVSEQKRISFEGKRVLLVEDNELNQEIAVEILQDAGFVVGDVEGGVGGGAVLCGGSLHGGDVVPAGLGSLVRDGPLVGTHACVIHSKALEFAVTHCEVASGAGEDAAVCVVDVLNFHAVVLMGCFLGYRLHGSGTDLWRRGNYLRWHFLGYCRGGTH